MIKIFSTGGTIDKVVFSYNTLEYVVGDPQVRRILEYSNVRIDYDVEEILKKDSLELTSKDRQHIFDKVIACNSDKIIITHGTDSVTETAAALKTITGKTIVLTGSMYPAKFFDTDANFNIGGAVIAAQILPPGIYLVMNGLVVDPLKVRKNTTNADYETIE